MSGIFDVLRTALKRPENDRIDQEERDVHSDGEVNQVSPFSLPHSSDVDSPVVRHWSSLSSPTG